MQFSHKDIISMSEGDFFGHGNAQLPNSYMLMIDEISYISESDGQYEKGLIFAELDIHRDHWFFDCHFKGDPVMPGCLGLDALWQLVGVFLGYSGFKGKGRALGVGNVKFMGQIYPNAGKVRYRIDIKRIFTKPMPLAIANGYVIHNDKVIYEAHDLKVGLINEHN